MKKELSKKVKQLEEELAKVRRELAGIGDRVGTFGFVPEAGTWEDYHMIAGVGSDYGLFTSCWRQASTKRQEEYKGLFWRTKEEADDFAEALNVQFELRGCDGVKVSNTGEFSCHIYYDLLCENLYILHKSYTATGQVFFKSEEAAENAIEKVGRQRIINSLKVLSGIRLD